MASKCKCHLINDFWIEVRRRNLGDYNSSYSVAQEGLRYICHGVSFKNDEDEKEYVQREGMDLTEWFYSILRYLKKIESDHDYCALDIRIFPADVYHYCDDREGRVVRSSYCKNTECDKD